MRGRVSKIGKSWYMLGLPKMYSVTVWITTGIALSVSVLGLFLWATDAEVIHTGILWYPMHVIDSICIILASTAIIIQRTGIQPGWRKYFSLIVAVIIAAVSITPGLGMTRYEAVAFLLIGIIVWLLQIGKPGLAHILTLPVAFISYFYLMGYILGIYADKENHLIPLALTTCIAMFSFCAAVFMIGPHTWLIRVFVSSRISGIIARQLLLPLIILPLIIGWFRIYGEKQGLFNSEVGVVLVALTYTFCFVILVWFAARSVDKVDRKRQESEEATRRSHTRMELLSEIASRLLVSEDPQKIVTELCNEIKDFLYCQVFFNYLVDYSENKLHLNAYSGIPESDAKKIEWLDFGTVVSGSVARDGVRIIDETIQETTDPGTELIRGLGINVYACYPLLSHDKVIGTLSFGSKLKRKFSEDDLSLMKIVADQVAIAMGRFQNENELRESEDRFRTIAESLPVQISIVRISDSVVRFTNEAYDTSFGYKQGELIGTQARDEYFDPDERNRLLEILKNRGSVNNLETKVRRADGTPFWIAASVRPISFEGQPAYLSALMDIDQRKKEQQELVQLNRTLNALGKSSHVMMHTNNELQYLREICKILTEDCGHMMVWIGYARDDDKKTVEPVAYYGLEKGYIDQLRVTWDNTERGNGPTGTAIKTGKPAICRNMLTDPRFEPWREQAVKRGYASSVVLPLLADGKAFGAVSIYSKESDAFGDDDVNLLSNLANDLAYGITNIRLSESERRAAKTIKESEEKYRLLFDEMTEGFALHEIILDDHGIPFDYRFISVNPAFEKQTGLKSQDVIGKTAREVLPATEKYWIDNYGKVAMEGKTMDFENYSSALNSYFRVSAFSPSKGFFAVIFENITKRILSEKELQNTKNYLENLINYANAPIIVWNKETEIQLFNHAFEHLTGYSSDEVVGKKLDILFPEASLVDSNDKIKIALTRNWETIEIPILTKNKLIRTVLWNSANIYDTNSTTILSTIAQGHDITERIAAENEVRTSKEKLDLALDNANIGIWTWDIKNNKFEWDERISWMFGLEREAIQGDYEEFEKYIYEEDVSHFTRAIQKARDENIPLDTIFRTRMRSGELKYIDAKARVEKDNQGKAVKMTGVCLDITAMKKTTEKTLFKLNEDLLRSNRELEQFAYVASHDLQEPLRMVSSFTQLLSARYKDKLDQQAQEFISFAVDGAQRMQRLINDLLQYSRIQTRGKSLLLINMNDVLKQVLHNLGIRIRESKAVVTSDPLPEVFADSSQMQQLFQNLIENGIKFCDNNPRVHIAAVEDNDHFIFSVHDNGIGIEPQYFERIFQIFQRLHLKDEYGGTGIGLAICKRIVERHGGKIWVESGKDNGTTFKFTLRKS